MRRLLIASFCVLASAAPALAAPPAVSPAAPAAPAAPAPKAVPIKGVIVSVDGAKLTMKDDKGAAVTLTIAPDARMLQIKKIDISAIQPGSFVATANVTQADGSGVSSELRVFGPSLRGMGEGSYPMDDGQNMTNGTVKVVASTPKGREMDVTYNGKGGPGVRHITVPADMTIRSMDKIATGDLKPGAAVEVRAIPGPDGGLVARAVIIGENGQPPIL